MAWYYLYGPAGRAVVELSSDGGGYRSEIFAGGRHIATYVNNTTYFDYSDWLGTERLTATVSGTEQDACTSLPYDDDFACSGPGSDPSPLHFTGQQHDNETGLDHFPARNYTPTWGVWMTPDWSRSPTGVPYATFSDPQSLGLYNYTLGNPETNADPNGHWCFLGIGTTCPPSRTTGSGVGGNGPALSGPSWITRCQANLFCGAALDAGLAWWEFNAAQVDRQVKGYRVHPVRSAALLGLSLVGGPELEEGGAMAEEASPSAPAAGETAAGVQPSDTPEVTFGHGARHLAGTGLDAQQVEGAIAQSVRTVSANASQTGSFWGRVTVDGTTVLYRAFTLPGGKINVGTYFPVEE